LIASIDEDSVERTRDRDRSIDVDGENVATGWTPRWTRRWVSLSLARAGGAAYRSIGSRRRARRSKTIERAFLIAFVLRAARAPSRTVV